MKAQVNPFSCTAAPVQVPVRNHGALFTWSERRGDYVSFLWIVPLERRFLKMRATYARPSGAELNAMKSAIDAIQKVSAAICMAH